MWWSKYFIIYYFIAYFKVLIRVKITLLYALWFVIINSFYIDALKKFGSERVDFTILAILHKFVF